MISKLKNLAVLVALATHALPAQAATLPEGAMTFNWTTATASSNSLWYRDDFTGVVNEFSPDGTLRDISTGLKLSYGLTNNLELFGSIGVINKSHTLSSGDVYINNTEPTYLSAGVRTALPNFVDINSNVYGRFDYAFNSDQEFFFTSGNDRSHHIAVGMENSYMLPWLSTFVFMDNNFTYRTQHAPQYQGTWGAGWSNGKYTVSGFYHLLTSTDTGFDCFHDPTDENQFHYLPLYKANSSNPRTRGLGWDMHHGPGASVSMAVSQGFTVELFTYIKIAGVNTDRTASLGANLSYALY
jgi:hypothetical protein